jgi:hypothetical protein
MGFNMEIISAVKEVGLVAVLVLGILGLCIWLVKYVATTLAEKIHENTSATKDLGDRLHKASEYQRKEHEKQLEILARLVAHQK